VFYHKCNDKILYVLRSVSVSNCVWSNNSKNSHFSHEIGSNKRERNNKTFTYRHSKYRRRLLQLLDGAVVSVVWAFYGAYFKRNCTLRRQTYIEMKNWQFRKKLLPCNLTKQISEGLLDVLCSTACTRSGWIQTVTVGNNKHIYPFFRHTGYVYCSEVKVLHS
jgi:hypothetical protein